MKPKVVFLIDTLQTGGAERSLLEIAKCFKKYDPVFVQLFDKRHDLKPEFDAAGITVIDLNLKDTFQYRKMARQAYAILNDLHPVLIHSTLFKSDMVSRALADLWQVPLINSLVNNSYSRQRYHAEPFSVKIKLWLLQQWDAITAKRVTLFLSNSESIRMTNARALKLHPDRIKVIYRGRSVKPFTQVTNHHMEVLRNELNLINKKIFLNVSRLIERKGQLDLIRAFAQVCNQRNDCILLIAGEGPFRERLEHEVRVLSLKDQVRFIGNRNDVPLLLKASDYFVFPSHYEGLPGALIEAMFARVPILASSIPENRECLNENMALFHEVGNINELASQMMKLMEDSHRKERTDQAFDFALIHFEISKVAEQYEALYDTLVRGVTTRADASKLFSCNSE